MDSIIDQPLLLMLMSILASVFLTILISRMYWTVRMGNTRNEVSLKSQGIENLQAHLANLKGELSQSRNDLSASQISLTREQAETANLKAQLLNQKSELTDIHRLFQNQFENMANDILDRKSEKFSKLNEQQVKGLIEPLGNDIEAFKQKVIEESKERFSLGEKVKELSQLNTAMSEVAINLTNALKGESKTQGRWGELVLETILDKSGLRKDEQYFMEYQLFGKDGKPLRSESQGKKMRPDALIKYPDDRNVIIDSKVSLTAYIRSTETDLEELREVAMAEHLQSVKTHIRSLSEKAYDDYDKSLDFVMMFIPNEPAYIAAMQSDPELWHYAYDKRILLQSPTNLITSLKLIEELWKRETHNQNAKAIAERGAKLYDKFVGFVDSLEDVGAHLDKAKNTYDQGFKKLSTGRGNLVQQAHQLKSMIGKTKKTLSEEIVDQSEAYL